jgi:catecholate siderophore receptor
MKNESIRKSDTNGRRGRKRGTARLFVLSAAFLASVAASAPHAAAAQTPAAAAQPTLVQFNIQAGPLNDVIAAFQAATGAKVTFALDSIGQIQSPGVAGRMTSERALQTLLAGTSLAFSSGAPAHFTIDVQARSESVEVTAALPTVQSPKYSVPLRDIAQSIALVPRDVIEQQGAVTLSDVMRNVPGITMQAGEGGGASNTAGDMFNMRGFNASNSLFVDGVRDDGLISRDVYNLEQVEVFMGPTGSDVGRGTASGYVNMQSKSPHMGRDGSAMLTLGSADEKRLTADLNLAAPQVQDGSWFRNAALRVNLLWQDSGVPGRDAVARESRAFAPSLALGIGTPTRLTVGAQIMRQDNLPDYGIPGAAWNEPLTPTSVLAPSAVDQTNYYGSPAYDYDRADQDTYTARVEHDLTGRMTLRNQTRYNRTHREAVVSAIQNVAAFDAATNLVTIARQGNERENTVVSTQTSLSGRFNTGTLRHAANVGVEIAHEEQFAPTLTGLGTRSPVNIFSPNPGDVVAGYSPTRGVASTRGDSTTVAAYAFDSIELNQRWQVSGGIRVEHFETTFDSVAATGVSTTIDARDNLVSGKAGLLFRATDDGNVYVSYGTSLTPPGGANFTLSAQANNVNNPSVEPQKSTNYEVGSKWDVAGGRLSLNGAVFHTRNENVIFTVDATATPPVFNQDDEQLVTGMTLGGVGRLTNRWDVLANIGYLDSEFRSQGEAGNGRRLVLTPAASGSIWSTYRLPVGEGLTVGGGVRYTGSAFINAANTIKLPAYHVVDALAEYPVNAYLSLRLNVYNATDERYIRSINNNGGRYNPGSPRSAAVTLRVRY